MATQGYTEYGVVKNVSSILDDALKNYIQTVFSSLGSLRSDLKSLAEKAVVGEKSLNELLRLLDLHQQKMWSVIRTKLKPLGNIVNNLEQEYARLDDQQTTYFNSSDSEYKDL